MLNTLKTFAADVLWKGFPYANPIEGIKPGAAEELRTQGYTLFSNVLTPEACDNLVTLARDVMESRPELVSVESKGSDKRIYGVDRVYKQFALDNELSFSRRVHESITFGRKQDSFTLLGHIKHTPDNQGSGAGWHRDSPFSHQLKIIMYLTDVTLDNGAFEYVPGSHRSETITRCSKTQNWPLKKDRFTNDQIAAAETAGVLSNRVPITGPKGTLLLADTRGLHRGRPLVSGERFAVTRYYFDRGLSPEFARSYPALQLAASAA